MEHDTRQMVKNYHGMKYFIIPLLLVTVTSMAQQAVVREVERTMTTYPYFDPDPVARPGRVYPYYRFDGFSNKPEMKNWKMVELENDYIRLAVMPDIGGKVWEAVEKSRNYPFIFSTHVVKFRDIALRGPWTTGGLEFNFADIGHATTASTPVDYFTRTNPDGSVSCFIGATEWASRTTWRVEVKLAPDKAFFSTRAWWYNNTPVEQEFYHWVNGGFKAEGNLEFIFPGTHHIGHGGEFDTWPIDSVGRDISFYEKNNFGSYKSYHIIGRPSNIYGAYWHNDGMGFGRLAPYYEKLGKKVWILGLSQEGTRWENLLGDADGLNVEMQSGRLFNQASRGSERTPFKHVGFAPYITDTWTDSWFPLKGTGGMTNASLRGALNLRVENGWLKIDWMSLGNLSDSLVVLDSGHRLLDRWLEMKPMDLFRDSIRWNGNTDNIEVMVGKDIITNDPGKALGRPLESPKDFDWDSDYGLYVEGQDLSRQKNYIEAEKYLGKALELNPDMVPALDEMAQLMFRQGLYEKSNDYARRALAVDTYDAAANYFWGLSSEKLGRKSDAYDGYSVAALSPEYRQAAWLRLAYLAIRNKNWKEADYVIGKCFDSYPPNENARVVKAVIERERGNNADALMILDEQLRLDPLNHMARYEKYRNTGSLSDRDDFVHFIRQEMPWETFIEMAIQYYEWNLEDEALRILNMAPVHPVVHLWQAWLLDRAGEKERADDRLMLSLAASPELVFPFRPETEELLRWANSRKPDWKWRYYDGLVLWQENRLTEARSLFNSCGDEPDFVPFYLAKADLFRGDSLVSGEALEKAWKLDPGCWRSGIRLTRHYAREKQPEKALKTATENYRAHPASFVVGLQYAQMLKLNKKYPEALKILNKLEMLPAEGDVNAHTLFREANILYALDLMKAGKYRSALSYLQKAETWPENLFSGEPYLADNRVTRLLSAYCHHNLKLKSETDKDFAYIEDFSNPYGRTSSYGNSLTTLVKGGSRDFRKIAESLTGSEARDRDREIMTTFLDLL
jgi:tetratricopeptide (TPR) repeat protein